MAKLDSHLNFNLLSMSLPVPPVKLDQNPYSFSHIVISVIVQSLYEQGEWK